MSINWNEIINVLKKIADIQFQRNVWAEGLYFDSAFSYGEACNLLDDYGYYEIISQNKIKLSEQEHQYIVKFNELLLGYDEPENIKTMLNDSFWLIIVANANIVVEIIESVLKGK